MPKRSTTKLTERIAEAACADSNVPGSKDRFLWDRELPGFGLRVWPSGQKRWLIQYRRGKQSRRLYLGDYPAVRAEAARTAAHVHIGKIKSDSTYDPAEQRDQIRQERTLRERYEEFLAAPARTGKNKQRPRKPRTVEVYREIFRRFILPSLGSKRPREIAHRDVQKIFGDMSKTPRQANHVLSVLHAFFVWAAPGLPNPCVGIDRHEENRRECVLTAEQMAKLGAALDAAEQEKEAPQALAAIRLLLLTGCRKSEILTLRWEHVNFERACLELPDSKTGAKRVPLNTSALQVLASIKREEGSECVIGAARGPRKNKAGPAGNVDSVPVSPLAQTSDARHFQGVQKVWQRIRAKAGLDKLRLHDLRHNFASQGAGMGESLIVLGKALGHRQAATTQRYAHLQDDPVRRAVERIGNTISAAVDGKSAEIISMRKGDGTNG